MREAVLGIIAVIERETDLVKQLVEVLQEDQQRVIRQDVDGLEQSKKTKEELTLRLQAEEQSRQELTRRIGESLGIPVDEVRVSKICPLLGPEGEELEAAAEKLRSVVGGLSELVAVSRGFLEQSILGIRGLLTLIQSLRMPNPGAYDATGRVPPTAEPAGMAVRREI